MVEKRQNTSLKGKVPMKVELGKVQSNPNLDPMLKWLGVDLKPTKYRPLEDSKVRPLHLKDSKGLPPLLGWPRGNPDNLGNLEECNNPFIVNPLKGHKHNPISLEGHNSINTIVVWKSI